MNAEELRRRWDERAAADARFHIRADRSDWTDEAADLEVLGLDGAGTTAMWLTLRR